VWFEGSGTGDKRFLHTDQLRSVVATSDGSGTVQSVSTYNESGLRSVSNSAYASRFGFTGQVWLAEIVAMNLVWAGCVENRRSYLSLPSLLSQANLIALVRRSIRLLIQSSSPLLISYWDAYLASTYARCSLA